MQQSLDGKEYPFAMLHHRWAGNLAMPEVRLSSFPSIDNTRRVKICERLLKAYLLAKEAENSASFLSGSEDLWSRILATEFSSLLDAIEAADPERMSDVLMEFGNKPVWFGGLSTGIDGFNSQNFDRNWIAVTYFDKLVSLAEYLGLIAVEVNESNEGNGKNLHINVDKLIHSIENRLGISIAPPAGVTPIIGIATADVPLNYRHILGLYGALRCADFVTKEGVILEIGGGLGLTALYARRMGIEDFTLLDLPLCCVLSGHYLINALGESHVCLYGEDQSTDRVKVMPYWEIARLPSKSFDLILNQDSFPEMADDLIISYLTEIKRLAKKTFLSLNCERGYPRTVFNFVQSSGGFKQLYRAKSFIREGYVEEAFKVL
jgi:hypothetical protein